MPRKKPFSGKQKKFQLKAKRQEKNSQASASSRHQGEQSSSDEANSIVSGVSANSKYKTGVSKPKKADIQESNPREKYKLLFQDEDRKERQRRKDEAMLPYKRRSPTEMEAGVELFYDPPIMFPVRPEWNRNLTPAQLEQQEHRYFQKYCDEFVTSHSLGYVELNLETWRQLWRVLEMSDILLHIIDVRFSVLHFNPALYYYVTKKLEKKVIVVLNKCDIVPPQLVIAWKHYLLEEFPELDVVIFTSFPKDEATRDLLAKGKQARRRRKKASAVGPLDLWDVCNSCVNSEINIDSWKVKILDDMKLYSDDGDADSDQSDCEVEGEITRLAKLDLGFTSHTKYKDGILTIGCIGYPNVGKSSVINGLMGHKVVSISRTPGHTKHFQTIFLTSNVRLCDCPGLVFPSTAPRAVQVLAGMYPVAQLREPYSVVQYLAERCDITACLGIRLPADETAWSAYLICDELAELKGFKTGRGARTDPYRAANWILRAALEGKILSYLLPPQYNSRQDYWIEHAQTEWLQTTQMQRIAMAEGQGLPTASCPVEGSNSESDTDSDMEETEPVTRTNRNAFALLSEDC